MKKQRFQYGISGYRWAPESFQVIKGLPGQKKKAVPLTREERQEVGCRFLTRGFQAAVGYVKHIERKRAHKGRLRVTYGFWSGGNLHPMRVGRRLPACPCHNKHCYSGPQPSFDGLAALCMKERKQL